ncbi:MAG: intermediate filament protein [Siphoviridae sp. ctCJE6]|nr:MAG: intermediate filament protein [Siphoviridae sp. ctCJE6]
MDITRESTPVEKTGDKTLKYTSTVVITKQIVIEKSLSDLISNKAALEKAIQDTEAAMAGAIANFQKSIAELNLQLQEIDIKIQEARDLGIKEDA